MNVYEFLHFIKHLEDQLVFVSPSWWRLSVAIKTGVSFLSASKKNMFMKSASVGIV